MENNRKIYVSRSGRHARQLYFDYKNICPSRKINQRLNMANEDQQQQMNEILRQRQEIANEAERLHLMREELENMRNNLLAQPQAI